MTNMKIKFEIEYDGTKFHGWQSQAGQLTVQDTLEKAISQVFGGLNTTLYGAGRTDTGVHAIAQVAHIEIADENIINRWKTQTDKLVKAINFYLHDTGVVINKAMVVPADFHARFSAKSREYLYIIYDYPSASVLLENRAWCVKQNLDEEVMNKAAQLFIGTHNFNAFRSADCQARNPIRTIDVITVYRRNNFIIITVKAKSFLHNQVRIMVGTLKQVGVGKFNLQKIQELLDNGDRTQGGPTAPAYGLYFKKVQY